MPWGEVILFNKIKLIKRFLLKNVCIIYLINNISLILFGLKCIGIMSIKRDMST